jgi:hypothetical protein
VRDLHRPSPIRQRARIALRETSASRRPASKATAQSGIGASVVKGGAVHVCAVRTPAEQALADAAAQSEIDVQEGIKKGYRAGVSFVVKAVGLLVVAGVVAAVVHAVFFP